MFNYRILKILVGISFFTQTSNLLSEESLREMCRKDVAGVLLNHFDTWNLSKEKLVVLEQSLKKSKTQLGKAQTELKQKEKALEQKKGSFDIHSVEAKDIAQAKVDTIHQKIQDIEASTTESQKNLSTSRSRYENFKKEAEKIFIIVEKKGKEKSNLLLEVQYRSDCPKYRAQCSLKESERKFLREKLVPQLDHKTTCENYSNIQ